MIAWIVLGIIMVVIILAGMGGYQNITEKENRDKQILELLEKIDKKLEEDKKEEV